MLQRLTSLLKNLVIYGLGDAATSLVSFLLLPIYVRYLTPVDYGVIGLLLTVEVVAKIGFRWGVDASFMRLYYDCPDQPSRQRLASTIFWFLVCANGVALAAALALAPRLATHLFGGPERATLLRLVLINIFVVGFYFIPFHVFRIKERSRQFIALSFGRSLATLLLRLLLVVGVRLGVLGVVLADILVTAAFTIVLARWFAPLIRPVFSTAVLREALSFGLPRLPHGVAHQIIATADRYLLTLFVSLRDIGLYSVGASFALAMKLFLSAFESAWAPFYFAQMKQPDAPRTFSLVATYGLAVLVLLTAGLAATAGDVVRLMTRPEFYDAARVIPWIGLGVLFQGVYLLTSIGLNITKQTRYYPLATAVGAVTSVGANLILIPRFGVIGAAWANALAYAALAVVAMRLSQHFYPIRYEWPRLARVGAAGLVSWAAAMTLVPEGLRPFWGLLARGTTVALGYPALLFATGFYHPREMAVLRELLGRLRRRTAVVAVGDSVEAAGEIVSMPTADETSAAPNGNDVGREAWAEAGAPPERGGRM